MSATQYINGTFTHHCEDCKKSPYVRNLGFVEILAVCEKVVVDGYMKEQRPYLDMLDKPNERIDFLRKAQEEQPRGHTLQLLAMDEILTVRGIWAVIRYGIAECNPDMDDERLDAFMEEASADDRGALFDIFALTLVESSEKAKKEDAKRSTKKPKARTRPKKA